jgi:homoserine kinase
MGNNTASAAAVNLSGAGPAQVTLTPERYEAMAHAMLAPFRIHEVKAEYFILPIYKMGAVITSK